jgi:hypothetical protein
MRIARCIPKSRGTHLEYVIFIVFTLKQWLHERASMLRYTYIACLVTSDCWPVSSSIFVEIPTEHSEKCLATTVSHDITNVRFVLNAFT